MVKITIIASSSLGYPEGDHSIEIQEQSDLVKIISEEIIPKDKKPCICEFHEYFGYNNPNSYMEKGFPAVALDSFNMIWIQEIKEWIGLVYEYQGSCTELDGTNEWIHVDGPFKLDKRCAELIKEAYKSNIPIEEILYTSPDKLKGQDNGK